MESKENIITKIEAAQTVPKSSVTKWKLAALVGFCGVILIVTVAFTGVYVGRNLSDKTYKDALATYHDIENGLVIKERYIVDGIEVTVIIPGSMSVILDYDKEHVVMQTVDMMADDCMCMVFDLYKFTSVSWNEINAFLNQTYMEITQNFTMNRMALENTGEILAPGGLSRRSLEMCLGCKISKMNIKMELGVDGDQTRVKRYGLGKRKCKRKGYYYNRKYCFGK